MSTCRLGHEKDPGQPCDVCAEAWVKHVQTVQPPATPQELDEAAYQRVPQCLLDATGQTIDALRADNAKLKADLDEMRRASAPLAVWQDIERIAERRVQQYQIDGYPELADAVWNFYAEIQKGAAANG